ncbi:MAG: peptidase, partial [Bacteroidota bacterium]|nr:peptidase [Bacteroidota bacterium]
SRCAEQERDNTEITEADLKGLTFHYVNDMSEVLDIALTNEKVKRAKQL